jgi:hypothetical protein
MSWTPDLNCLDAREIAGDPRILREGDEKRLGNSRERSYSE